MNDGSINPAAAAPLRRHVLAVAVLLGTTALAYGWSVDDGLFFDDRWHQYALERARWSFDDLVASSTIEPAKFIHAWWQDKTVRWDYCRPVTMAWMKAVQTFSGGSASAQHFSALGWHGCCCVLVYGLCFQVTRRMRWSLFAAVVFAIYPHNAFAATWLAAQNAVMQTTLTLAALLCYIRASGLVLHQGAAGFSPRERSDREARHGHAEIAQAKACGSLRKGWFAAATVLFVAALFARENAVVFPLLTMACDLACGGWKHFRARRPVHLALLLCAAAFAVWRVTLFENHIPTAYLRLPDDWSYAPWLLAKLLHYLACVVWQAPLLIGPMAYDNPYAESTADAVLTAAVVALFAGAYCFACRRCVRGWWFWPVWILLSVLPVVPFLATPHMAYMAGVGFVIALVLKPASAQRGSARISTAVAVGMLLLSVMAFSVYGLCWRGVLAAERATIAQVTANPRPPTDADVFLINLPLANVYLPLDLERSWGLAADSGRVHVLTYAPHPLVAPSLTREAGPDPPDAPQGAAGLGPRDASYTTHVTGLTTIEQLDKDSFVLSIEGGKYFSGLLGRLLAEDMRRAGRFRQGQTVPGELFDAEILQADERGVSRIKFTFAEPLTTARYRFYIIIENCPGAELRFADQARLASDRGPTSSASAAYPVVQCLEGTGVAGLLRRREMLFKVLDITAKIIRTDLYLTGRSHGE